MIVSSLATFLLLFKLGVTQPTPDETRKADAAHLADPISHGLNVLNSRSSAPQVRRQTPEPEHFQVLRDLGYDIDKLLYRGDFRASTEVQQAGGLDSHGKSLLAGKKDKWPKEPDTGTPMTMERMLDTGSNLHYHAKFTNQHTQYVSMSTDLKVTETFGATPSKPGYVYVIHPSRAMIDLKNSFPADEQKHSGENEVVAPHHVPMGQILGWYQRDWNRETGHALGKFQLNSAEVRVAPGTDTGSISTQPALVRVPTKEYPSEKPVSEVLNRFLFEKLCDNDESKYQQVRPEILEASVEQMASPSGKRWGELREKAGPESINRQQPTEPKPRPSTPPKQSPGEPHPPPPPPPPPPPRTNPNSDDETFPDSHPLKPESGSDPSSDDKTFPDGHPLKPKTGSAPNPDDDTFPDGHPLKPNPRPNPSPIEPNDEGPSGRPAKPKPKSSTPNVGNDDSSPDRPQPNPEAPDTDAVDAPDSSTGGQRPKTSPKTKPKPGSKPK